MKKYRAYSEKEFLCDQFFQDWVLKPDPQSEWAWNNWLSQNKEKTAAVSNARRILEQIAFKEELPDEERVKNSLNRALDIITAIENTDEHKRRGVINLRSFIKVAAILIMVAGLGLLYYLNTGTKKLRRLETVYGTIKKIQLPDSSFIVLSANSKLSYRKDWETDKPREVWLEGEAYFKVKHLDPYGPEMDKRFLVHTKAVTIEVLGTAFDVRQRRNTITVVLESGKVKVSLDDAKRSITMKPGQILSVNTATESFTLDSTSQTNQYTSWIDKKLHLHNTPLSEIIQFLEDYHGKKFILRDPALGERKIVGTILLDNLDDALFVLSKVLNLKIVKQGTSIVLIPK